MEGTPESKQGDISTYLRHCWTRTFAKDTRLCRAITIEKRVAIALTRLATGNMYLSSGLNYGLPKLTSNTIKREFCSILARKAGQFLRFPSTEAETRQEILGFKDLGSFPPSRWGSRR